MNIELIKTKRKELLMHAYLYYCIYDTVWSDSQWDAAARELVQLHKEIPEGITVGYMDDYFNSWEGMTMFDATFDEEVKSGAMELLK